MQCMWGQSKECIRVEEKYKKEFFPKTYIKTHNLLTKITGSTKKGDLQTNHKDASRFGAGLHSDACKPYLAGSFVSCLVSCLGS